MIHWPNVGLFLGYHLRNRNNINTPLDQWIASVLIQGINCPANMKRWANVSLLLDHRLRRWPNSKPTLAQRLRANQQRLCLVHVSHLDPTNNKTLLGWCWPRVAGGGLAQADILFYLTVCFISPFDMICCFISPFARSLNIPLYPWFSANFFLINRPTKWNEMNRALGHLCAHIG